jgi:hypothetical protein
VGINQARKREQDGKPSGKPERKSQGANGTSATWRGYVSYDRDKAAKQAFETWAGDWELVTEALDTASSLGFKLSTGHSADDDSFRAQWYSSDAGRDDGGLALSAFAATQWDAIVFATFFLAVRGGYNLSAAVFTAPNVKVKKSFWE